MQLVLKCSVICFIHFFTIVFLHVILKFYLFMCFTAITQRILKCTEKSLFIVIGHQYFQGWNTDLDPQGNNAKTDIEHMKKFLTQYDNKIAGFIFKWILVGVSNAHIIIITRLCSSLLFLPLLIFKIYILSIRTVMWKLGEGLNNTISNWSYCKLKCLG